MYLGTYVDMINHSINCTTNHINESLLIQNYLFVNLPSLRRNHPYKLQFSYKFVALVIDFPLNKTRYCNCLR